MTHHLYFAVLRVSTASIVVVRVVIMVVIVEERLLLSPLVAATTAVDGTVGLLVNVLLVLLVRVLHG